MAGIGFRVWGLGFRVWGLGLRVWGLGLRVWGLGFRVFPHQVLEMEEIRSDLAAILDETWHIQQQKISAIINAGTSFMLLFREINSLKPPSGRLHTQREAAHYSSRQPLLQAGTPQKGPLNHGIS